MDFARRALLSRSIRLAAAAGGVALLQRPLTTLAQPARPTKVQVEDLHDERPGAEPTSRELPLGTTHVGFRWRGPSHRRARVEVRLSPDGRRWSAWESLDGEPNPADDEESFSALVDTRGTPYLQYRAVLPAGGKLDRLTVTAIGVDGAAGRPPAPSTGPSASFTTLDGRQRAVFTRADWGCDESLGLSGGQRIWPAMFVATQKVIVHHTATGNRYRDGAAEVRAIYTYHAQSLGWGDIGYNALVDRFGNVYEGRRGRETSPREVLSWAVVAGHTSAHNYGTTGLAVIGDFSKRKIDLGNSTDRAMVAALDDLTVYECGRGGIPAGGSSDFLRSDDAWHDAMSSISGHKDSTATACPGSSLYNYLSTLRRNATERLGPYARPSVSCSTSSRTASSPASLSFSWSGEATSCRYRLEGWRKINADDIEYWTPSGWTTTEPAISWTSGAGSGEVSFSGLARGHYSFHVQGLNSSGSPAAVEGTATVLVG